MPVGTSRSMNAPMSTRAGINKSTRGGGAAGKGGSRRMATGTSNGQQGSANTGNAPAPSSQAAPGNGLTPLVAPTPTYKCPYLKADGSGQKCLYNTKISTEMTNHKASVHGVGDTVLKRTNVARRGGRR